MSKRFKVGQVNGVGVAAIWEGAEDTLPFTDPLAHADRVKFSSTFNYSRIIDKRTVNCSLPAARYGGLRIGTVNLFAHGQPGEPRVRGNITLGGKKISLGCHVPIQVKYDTTQYNNAFVPRIIALGVTTSQVVMCWSCDLNGFGSSYGNVFPAITFPVTVEVFDELN